MKNTASSNAKSNIDFPANKSGSILFKCTEKTIGETSNDDNKDVELMIQLMYLSNFCRTLEMSLFNCEINLIVTLSPNSFLVASIVPN